MKFSDLKFKPHPSLSDASIAELAEQIAQLNPYQIIYLFKKVDDLFTKRHTVGKYRDEYEDFFDKWLDYRNCFIISKEKN